MADDNKETRSLPDSVEKLIGYIGRKMRYRRSVREDVQRELGDHFEDELRECEGEAEREKKALELVSEFGDADMLAVLMRRAKKRCRPLWCKAVIRAGQGLGVLVILFIVYCIWFVSGSPTISVDYAKVMNEICRPEVVDADNAWPSYARAIDAYVEKPARVKDLPRILNKAVRLEDLDAEEQQQIKNWLSADNGWENLTDDMQAIVLDFFERGLVPAFGMAGAHSIGCTDFWRAIDSIRYVVAEESRRVNEAAKPPTEAVDRAYTEDLHSRFVRESFSLDANLPLEKSLLEWAAKNNIEGTWRQLQDAVDAGAVAYWIEHPPKLSGNTVKRLLPYQVEALQRWIAANEQSWRHFVQGSRKNYCYRPYDFGGQTEHKWLINARLPHLQPLRKVARVGLWRARLARRNGDLQQGLADGPIQ